MVNLNPEYMGTIDGAWLWAPRQAQQAQDVQGWNSRVYDKP